MKSLATFLILCGLVLGVGLSLARAQSEGAEIPTAPAGTGGNEASSPGPQGSATADSAGITELEGFLEPFIYDNTNRRDPFRPYGEAAAPSDEPGAGGSRAPTPAQRWELERLKLVGIMWDVKDPKAMFLDPEDEVMILGRDESIGTRNGYVAAIREGEVVIVEGTRKRGDVVYRSKVLRLER